MSIFGITCITMFFLGLIGGAIYDFWKLKKRIACREHTAWIDEEKEPFYTNCGEKVHDTR